jgi:hypothetical protein
MNKIQVSFKSDRHALPVGGVVVRTSAETSTGVYEYYRYTIKRSQKDDGVTIEYTTGTAVGAAMPNRVTKHGVWNQTSYDWDWEGEGERKPTKKVSADKTVEHILRILQEEKDKLDS